MIPDRQYRREVRVSYAVAIALLPFVVLLSPFIAVKLWFDTLRDNLADDRRRAERREEDARFAAAIEKVKKGGA